MKYILLCVAVMVISLAAGAVLTRLLDRKRSFPGVKKVLLALFFGVLIMAGAAAAYLGFYSHAEEEAFAALDGSSQVQVTRTGTGWYFDGPGSGSAVIFYPGAKVETEAYAPLLLELAAEGEDCFLVSMPFHMAVFGTDRADDYLENYEYEDWYMAGHSLGGTMAAAYAASHPDEIRGLILLASYPAEKLPDGLRFCSIYGDRDGCLDLEAYENGRANWPDEVHEEIIAGGNHARFGCYGFQKGDGEAEISARDQQETTVREIIEFINRK